MLVREQNDAISLFRSDGRWVSVWDGVVRAIQSAPVYQAKIMDLLTMVPTFDDGRGSLDRTFVGL